MLYQLAKPILFTLKPEFAHHAVLSMGKWCHRFKLYPLIERKQLGKPVELMGLRFPNAIGLAAGLDKNGDYIDLMASLGFGFIEIGTVTPKPQAGNPKPRLFRLRKESSLINQMGFNNNGLDYLLKQVQQAKYRGILGINIGKNATTPDDQAVQDYLIGLRHVFPHASYITINISSPNTQGLRNLQFGDALKRLLHTLRSEHIKLRIAQKRHVPLVVKLSPDLSEQDSASIAEILLEYEIDGVIATNTSAELVQAGQALYGIDKGGMSGQLLTERSTKVIKQLHDNLGDKIPIIAAGGILSAADAQAKLAAGAKLIQLYTGLIYRGPGLVREIAKQL